MEPSSDEDPSSPSSTLSTINNILSTTLHSISLVQIFKLKWSLISTTLLSLQTLLSTLPPHPSPLLSDLLLSLSSTLSSASSLSSLCLSPSSPPPKLKTQNSLDSLLSSLHSLLHDLRLLLNSPSPEPISNNNNKRESIRAEARSLITRLQIGSTDSKNAALDSLLGLLQEDDKNVLIAVAQGIVPVLVHLLDSTISFVIKEKAVTAISRISTVGTAKHVLLSEGLVLLNNLLRVLQAGSVFAKEKTCVALKALSNSKENARAIGSRGGVSSLLEICQDGTPNSQALAAGVLRNLAAFEEMREVFVEENAVFTLLGLCNSGTALAQENALGCLTCLVSGDDELKLVFAREGGIECVKNFWDSAPTAQNLEVAVQMVRTLASCPVIAEYLVANGFLNRVVGVLNCGVLGVRIASANAVCDLAYSAKTRKELGEMGCVSLLVRMLDGKAIEEREAAAKALLMLMSYAGNRRILRKEEKGIVSAVQLLDPSVQGLDKRCIVSLLYSLVHSKKCRKQMLAAGARPHLQKLAEANVDGAKKLLDSLGHGKLWGVFGKH